MPRFTHPRLEDVPIELALHALADPNRLGMVARLADAEQLSCTNAAPCNSIPKSTLSNHLKLLGLRVLVVSVEEKARRDRVRCDPERRTQVNHCRSVEMYREDVETERDGWLGMKVEGSLPIARLASGTKMA